MKNIKLFEAWSAAKLARQGSRKAIYKFIYNDGRIATWFDDSFGKTWKSADKELRQQIKDAEEWGWHGTEQSKFPAPTRENIGILDTRNNYVLHTKEFKWKKGAVEIDPDEYKSSTATYLK